MIPEPSEPALSLRGWAEGLLLSTRLEDKLRAAPLAFEPISGPPISVPDQPGRPEELRLDRPGRARFPTAREQESEEGRGRLLHFFANHELLALELMALQLLRWPERPAGEQEELVGVIQDEQRHLQLYLDRMTQLGVRFGDAPLSDFFWKTLHRADSPEAFHAGMGLTLEQANLDFAAAYRQRMEELGDSETARILARVLADEIRHVAHAVRALQPRPGCSLWESYCDLLPPPLTPARARSKPLQRAARRRAGIPDEFTDQLLLFRHSRGRPPDLWRFHCGFEEELASPSWQAPDSLQALQRDLELLPLWLARGEDAVWVARRPPSDFLLPLLEEGLELPQLFQDPRELRGRTLGSLRPWGWTPQEARRWQSLIRAGAEPPTQLKPSWASKTWWAEQRAPLLEELSRRHPGWIQPASLRAVTCTSLESLRETLKSLPRWCIKPAFGASGRGQLRGSGALTASQERRLKRPLREHGVVVEPWLERVLDLSVHLELEEEGPRWKGWTRQTISPQGRYQGAWLGHPLVGLESSLLRSLQSGGRRQLEQILRSSAIAAGELLHRQGARGPLGIDALVYQSEEGLSLQPALELNPRWTFGRLALELKRRWLGPKSEGWLRLEHSGRGPRLSDRPHLRDAAAPCWRDGRLVGGRLYLSPLARAERLAVWVDVVEAGLRGS